MSLLFEVFANLAACSACGGGATATMSSQAPSGRAHTQAEEVLTSLLRVQMGSTDGKTRRLGVIGTVALIKAYSRPAWIERMTQAQGGRRHAARARKLLNLTFVESRSQPECFAFLCDEMSLALEDCSVAEASLPGGFAPGFPSAQAESTRWLQELRGELHCKLSSELADLLLDLDTRRGGKIPQNRRQVLLAGRAGTEDQVLTTCWFDAARDPEGVYLPLMALVASPNPPERAKLVSMCSLLRLTQTLERAQAGHLVGLGAVGGAPLQLFPRVWAEDRATFLGLTQPQREAAVMAMFYATCWLRELLGAFAPDVAPGSPLESDPETLDLLRGLVAARAGHLAEAETLLARLLAWHHDKELAVNKSVGAAVLPLPDLRSPLSMGASDANRSVVALLFSRLKIGQVKKGKQKKASAAGAGPGRDPGDEAADETLEGNGGEAETGECFGVDHVRVIFSLLCLTPLGVLQAMYLRPSPAPWRPASRTRATWSHTGCC